MHDACAAACSLVEQARGLVAQAHELAEVVQQARDLVQSMQQAHAYYTQSEPCRGLAAGAIDPDILDLDLAPPYYASVLHA